MLRRKVFGVIEIASFNQINQYELEFVNKVALSIANNLNTVKMNDRNIRLIKQFKDHSEMMHENEQRLKQNLEELEFIREQYEMLKRTQVSQN